MDTAYFGPKTIQTCISYRQIRWYLANRQLTPRCMLSYGTKWYHTIPPPCAVAAVQVQGRKSFTEAEQPSKINSHHLIWALIIGIDKRFPFGWYIPTTN